MDFLLHIIVTITFFLTHALGYNVVFGRGKILHFGLLGTSLVAGYVTYIVVLATGSFAIGIAAGFAGTMAVSVLFWWLSLRLEPDGLGVMSIAVHLMLLSIVLNWTDVTRGALGIPGLPRPEFLQTLPAFAAFSLALSVTWVAVLWRLDRSAFGRSLQAIAEQEQHAAALGISRAKTHLLAFLIAGVGALLSNVLVAAYLRILHPNDFAFPFFIVYLMVVVAGKPGSVPGVALSTTLIILLREALRFLPLPPGAMGPVRLILFGVILFAVVWWRRDTLFPQPRKV